MSGTIARCAKSGFAFLKEIPKINASLMQSFGIDKQRSLMSISRKAVRFYCRESFASLLGRKTVKNLTSITSEAKSLSLSALVETRKALLSLEVNQRLQRTFHFNHEATTRCPS